MDGTVFHDGAAPQGTAAAARRSPKPRRLPSTRTELTDVQLAAINHIVATTGNDPELITLILRLHTETACRTVPGSGADFDIVLAPPQH